MSKKLQLALPVILFLALPGIVPAQQQQNMSDRDATTAVGAMPSRGMTKDDVRRYFGKPLQRYAPVGDPPISRWQYDGMMVYFEYKYVIHAVATDDKPQ